MRRDEFLLKIDEMKGVWGKNAFVEKRLDVIFDKLNFLEFDQFAKVCDDLMRTQRSAPLPNDFISAAQPHIQMYKEMRRAENEKKLVGKEVCAACGNTGLITAKRKVDGYKFSFRCGVCDCYEILDIPRTLKALTRSNRHSLEVYYEFDYEFRYSKASEEEIESGLSAGQFFMKNLKNMHGFKDLKEEIKDVKEGQNGKDTIPVGADEH